MTSEQWQSIKSLFERALTLPEEERAAFVKNAVGSDEQVRNKVLDMLRADSGPDSFLEDSCFDAALFWEAEAKKEDYYGRRVGLYRIEAHIGEGGMGNVYLAAREDDFHKKVALKILKRGMDTDTLLKRFRQERQILANLDHPNIARLLDGGSTEDGLPYLVMEYIEGQPLTEYCDERRLSLVERLRLFVKVCRAVEYAHQNLVVHRDIKPSNIIVDKDGAPRLLDFGIARILDPDSGEPRELTMEGSRVSTPEYASPEQLRGGVITTASDIYSLGVLLYKLLTGRRPQQQGRGGRDDRPPQKPGLLVHARGEAPPGMSPDRLSRRLRGDLDNIILKALNRRPERRYASVGQFAEDIDRHLRGMPVLARGDGASYRMMKFAGRHRWAIGAVVTIFLTLVGAVVGVSRQAAIAENEANKAGHTLEFVKKMLSAADPLESGRELTVEQLLDAAAGRIPEELAEQPAIESDIRSILGEAYQNLGIYEKALTQFEANRALIKKMGWHGTEKEANAYRQLAVGVHYLAEYSRADSLYRKALEIYRQAGDTLSAAYGTALNDFGTLPLDQGNYKKAIELFKESLRISRLTMDKNDVQIGITYNNLALAYDDFGAYARADTAYKQALAIFRLNYGDEHPEIANTLNNYAFVKLNVGDTLASLKLHERALAMYGRLAGEKYPSYGKTLHNVAAVNYYLRNYKTARENEEKVIELFKIYYREDHPNLASAYFLMGRILNAVEQFDKARKYLNKALVIRKARLNPHHPALAGVFYELGLGWLGQNNRARAREMLLEAQRIVSSGEHSEDSFRDKINMALAKTARPL